MLFARVCSFWFDMARKRNFFYVIIVGVIVKHMLLVLCSFLPNFNFFQFKEVLQRLSVDNTRVALFLRMIETMQF